MNNAKVLIVEDELIIASDLQNILKNLGYEVTHVAMDGEEAIESVKRSRPDIILMDIVLGGEMDGIEAANYIRENFHVPVIFLTSHSDEKTLQRAKFSEPYGYILKPIHRNELNSTIETVLYRHQLEKKVRESEYKYRLVVENAEESIFILVDGSFSFVNSAALKITGMSEDELLGKAFLDLVAPEDREMVGNIYAGVAEEPSARRVYEFRIIDSTGETKWVEVHPVPIEWMGAVATLYFMKDITELKKMVEALRISEEKFSKAFSCSPNAISISSFREGIFIEVNDNFITYTGYTREELYGKTAQELNIWVSEGSRIEYVRRLAREGSLREFETRFRTKQGEVRSASLSASKIEIGDQPCIVTVMMDTTLREQLEGEVLKAKKMESVGILAGGIAHDFNNLLTVISGNIAFIKMIAPENAELNECIAEIEKASAQAKDLSAQLLNFSSLSRPVLGKAALSDIIGSRNLYSKIPSTIVLETDIPDSIRTLWVDPDQIQRVLSHIIDNACDAMDNEGTIRIKAENYDVDSNKSIPVENGPYVKVSISDEGHGIPRESVPMIFDPYFTTKKKFSEKGMGLGLSISYAIIKRHHGHITLDTTEGKGTTFYLYLPAGK